MGCFSTKPQETAPSNYSPSTNDKPIQNGSSPQRIPNGTHNNQNHSSKNKTNQESNNKTDPQEKEINKSVSSFDPDRSCTPYSLTSDNLSINGVAERHSTQALIGAVKTIIYKPDPNLNNEEDAIEAAAAGYVSKALVKAAIKYNKHTEEPKEEHIEEHKEDVQPWVCQERNIDSQSSLSSALSVAQM